VRQDDAMDEWLCKERDESRKTKERLHKEHGTAHMEHNMACQERDAV
jgi:hypothetical protein